ncbi:hypothetical protein P4574_29405, partial [Priestia megaterium]|uniref:hypothetical protein n=1 Tax=Priestia megaterium TaxID=1404 RepID=UPI002E1B381F|nr:hypothetical protein [Priestia megaterium]
TEMKIKSFLKLKHNPYSYTKDQNLGTTNHANGFWDQPPLFCLKYRRIALFSGRIESPKPLPPKEGRFFYET